MKKTPSKTLLWGSDTFGETIKSKTSITEETNWVNSIEGSETLFECEGTGYNWSWGYDSSSPYKCRFMHIGQQWNTFDALLIIHGWGDSQNYPSFQLLYMWELEILKDGLSSAYPTTSYNESYNKRRSTNFNGYPCKWFINIQLSWGTERMYLTEENSYIHAIYGLTF